MCSICLTNPCHPRCPNSPEEKTRLKCKLCGGGIYEGDKYFDDGEKNICRECMEEMPLDELLKLFNEEMKTA